MSRLSHFQRFSQPENHATNNTLLVFRYFYQSSPFKLGRVLTSLLDTDLSIGLTFDQQVKGSASVPDALIAQEPLRIFIETKRGAAVDLAQIRRHFKSMEQPGLTNRGDVLIALTKEQIVDSERKILASEGASHGITFASVTFSQIVDALRAQCADFEHELFSIVEDYESYLAEEELLEERNQWLVVVPCGMSIAENARFGIYYEPPSRPCKRNYRFIGLYNRKSVAYVGTIETIAIASFDGSAPNFAEEVGRLTDAQRNRITAMVADTPYYNLKSSTTRFYIVDAFVQTDARKISSGGIQGLRYLDLSKMAASYNSRKEYTSTELAAVIKGTCWE